MRGSLDFLNKVLLEMLYLQKPLGPPCTRVRILVQRGGPMGVNYVNIPDKASMESALLSFSHISKIFDVLPESCDETGM